MKRSSFFTQAALLIAGLFLFGGMSFAQTVPGSASLTWTNPTTSVEGVPLTGANALTGIEVHWATAPIADTDLTRPGQVTLGATAQATQQTIQVANGSTLYFRVRAVRNADKSAFSNQASKLIALSTIPGPPTNLQLNLIIGANGELQLEILAGLDEALSAGA